MSCPSFAHLHRTGLALSLLAFATGGLAQTPTRLQAGLWEHSVEMRSQSGQMEAGMKQAQAAMAAMTPEQRKMMEGMLAKQGVALGASPQKLRMCLSAEDAARDALPPAQDGCTQKASRKGNVWTVSFQCPARDGDPASSGEGTATLESSNAYSGKFTIRTQNGKAAEVLTMNTRARWVAADCGALRPAGR